METNDSTVARPIAGHHRFSSSHWVGVGLLPLLWFLAAEPVSAQAVYGSVRGTVVDASGGVLQGVTITLVDPQRLLVGTVMTDATGAFARERLLPGEYEVRAELQGFKTAIASGVVVGVDTTVPVHFVLEVGDLSEFVAVTGGNTLLKVDRADVSTSFESRELTDLPFLDRNFTRAVTFTPGALRFVWQHGAAENPQGSLQTQINGQPFGGTGYQLDGAENREPILGIIVINPTLESIQESKITSQNYDAEFGQATAGIVSVQTRSGTNELRGSLFGFTQDDRFQARNPFTQFQPDPLTGRLIPESTRHQFGGSIGGPIVSSRWFFFGDYQGRRHEQGGSRLLTVPTEAARRGDLSAYGVSIFDPVTGRPFPGAVIPESRLSPQARAIVAMIPLPNAPGRDNGTRDNYVAAGTETFHEDSFNARIDGRLPTGLNVFGRYSAGDFLLEGPPAFGDAGGAELVSLGGASETLNQNVVLGLDYAWSSSWLSEFRFGWFRYRVEVFPFDYGTTPAASAGIPGLNFDTGFTSGLPAMYIEGDRGFRLGSGVEINRCNCPLDQDESQWQVVGNLTRQWGTHGIKVGADVRHTVNLRVPSDRHRSGELYFAPSRTASPTLGGGLGLATFLIGDVTRFGRYVSDETNARELQWRHFYYAQDTWRVTPRITVAYGVRLDVINPQTVNEPGNGGWLDLATGEMLAGGIGSVDLAGNVANALNWAPRLGVTWAIDDRTVLRGGFGRSYDLGIFGSVFGHTVTQNLPVLTIQELNAASDYDRVFNLAQGPPPAVKVDVPPSGRFPLPNGVFIFALARKQRPPAVDAWNITLQRQFTSSVAAEVAYVANRGARAYASDTPDEPVNQPALDGFLAGVPRDARRPFYTGGVRPNVLGVGGNYGWTQDIGYFSNPTHNWYRSLQARFTKRFSSGTALQANYVWQRMEKENDDYWIYDPGLNKGPADFDRTHVFNALGVYELPFGHGQRFGADWGGLAQGFLGGWQVNGVLTVQSGMPINVTYRNAFQDRDVGPNRPDLIGDPSGPQTREQWFNATPIGSPGSAFGRPAPGSFGSLGYNGLRGPGFWQLDASVFKVVPLGGSRRLELRIESVNVLNIVNLGQPDAEIGVPDNPNPNAGRITNTAYTGNVPQRNLQFGARFSF